jgi:hypothetical protein
MEPSWRFPVPGTWLQVSRLDPEIEEAFAIGDKLYFRAISPMGLFECYAPTLKARVWIEPANVQVATDLENPYALEQEIPLIYRVLGMCQISTLGWEAWRSQQGPHVDA